MALRPIDRYPGQVDVDPGYPHGKARNAAAYQDGTGTPFEADLVNDLLGFLQSLLAAAGVAPSGAPDEVGESDYLDATELIAAAAAETQVERLMLANWQSGGSIAGSTNNKLAWCPIAKVFVALGNAGTIRTSPDGAVWTARTSGVASTLRAAAEAGVTIVAVGASGVITRSVNGGVTWTAQTSGTVEQLDSVVWMNDKFIAVGTDGAILTSPNGVTWTPRTSGTSLDLKGVTLDGSTGIGTLLVAVGTTGTILTSPDGVTWTARTSGVTDTLQSVAWREGRFVAAGADGTIVTSPDGVTWTQQFSGTSQLLNVVVATGHHFVIAGFGGVLLVSDNGLSWGEPVPTAPASTFPCFGGAWSGRLCLISNTTDDLYRTLWRLSP